MSLIGTSRTSGDVRRESPKWVKADIDQVAVTNRDFPAIHVLPAGRSRAAARYRGVYHDRAFTVMAAPPEGLIRPSRAAARPKDVDGVTRTAMTADGEIAQRSAQSNHANGPGSDCCRARRYSLRFLC